MSNSVGASRVSYIYIQCSFRIPVYPHRVINRRVMCHGAIAAYDPDTKTGDNLQGRWEIGALFVLI